MKKSITFLIWIISIYLGVVLVLSILLLQKDFYSYIFASNVDPQVRFSIHESNWHPTNPSLTIKDFKSESKEGISNIEEIVIEFSLMKFLIGEMISNVSLSGVSYYFNQQKNGSELSFKPINFLYGIDFLTIEDLRLLNEENKVFVTLDLNSSFSSAGPNVNANLFDENRNKLELRIIPDENLSGGLFRGFIHTEKFKVNEIILNLICESCNSQVLFKADSTFRFLDWKLIDIKGNLDLFLDGNPYGLNNINSSFKLQDSTDVAIQFSSYLNQDISNKLPNFLIEFNDGININIPFINLSEDLVVNSFIQLVTNNTDLNGLLLDTRINLFSNQQLLSSIFQEINMKHRLIQFEGLSGKISFNDNEGEVTLFSPLLKITSDLFSYENLHLNDFKSEINFQNTPFGLKILSSPFSSLLDGDRFEGHVSLNPVPTSRLGNISLQVTSVDFNHSSALKLFPKTFYLTSTYDFLSDFIECGSYKNAFVAYRGPIDANYSFNTASFGMSAEGRGLCIDVNSYFIEDVNTNFEVNNFVLKGKVDEGKFLESSIQANFETYLKEGIYFLNVNGTSEGPFSTITKLLLGENYVNSSSSGSHQTKFNFDSPLKQQISLLDKDSNLSVSSEGKRGEVEIANLKYLLNNIFFDINYDSNKGFQNGFVSMKANSIPLIFDLEKNHEKKGYVSFSAEEIIQLQNFLPDAYQSKVTGSSKALIEIFIPSLIKGNEVRNPYLSFKTDLLGTEIGIADPFYKDKQEALSLSLSLYPSFKNDFSRVQFRYDNLLRGKFNLSEKVTEGYLIAGKDKQSISIEAGIVSVIGKIERLNLDILDDLQFSTDNSNFDLVIKKLSFDEIVLSDFRLPKTSIRSIDSNEYLILDIDNKILRGTLSLPKTGEFYPEVDLDFINVNLSQNNSRSTFLNVFNNLDVKLKFKSKSLLLDAVNYGSWSFDLIPEGNAIHLENLEGIYGKWGLTQTSEGLSRLSISRSRLGWKSELLTKVYSGSPEKAFKQIGIEPNFEMDTFEATLKVNWPSLPWELDYPSILGDVSIDAKGLLILEQTELQTQNNLLRLVNIFNITDSFEKVTNLDFRKLYKSGFSADSVKGRVDLFKEKIVFNTPLLFKSGSSEFAWKGEIERKESGALGELNLEMIMTLPLREYLPAYALLLGGPITAGVVYIAGKAFERNLDQLSSGSWAVKGTLEDPKTEFKGWFEDKKK